MILPAVTLLWLHSLVSANAKIEDQLATDAPAWNIETGQG